MRYVRQLATLVISLCFSASLFAAPVSQANDAEIISRFGNIGLVVKDIKASDIEGLFEVSTEQGLFSSSPNGDNFIQGKLYGLSKDGQLVDTITQRYASQVESFAQDMIVYKADDEKYVITVFTDITCGYCVKLHKEMKDYNKLGITVRYLAYPRQGPNGNVATQMAQVWCANDPKAALDDIKLKRSFNYDVKNLAQCQQKIKDQYAYGQKLGINGTPAILLPNGRLVGGYLPPQDMLRTLQEM